MEIEVFSKKIKYVLAKYSWALIVFSFITPLLWADNAVIDAKQQGEVSELADIGEAAYYPQCGQEKVRLTQEDYLDKYHSLAGLTGVHVDFTSVLAASKKNGVTLTQDVVKEVTLKLEKAGLKLLTKEEAALTPGNPKFDLYPSYPAHTVNDKGVGKIDNMDCCTVGIWSSFSQGAALLRDPDKRFFVGTWGQGGSTNDCSNVGEWMTNIVLEKIDNFIGDYEKAEAEKLALQTKLDNPELLSTGEKIQYPECNSSIILYSELFDTNEDQIIISRLPVMTQLIAMMNHCQDYRYLIETHADLRADIKFNDDLTARRATTITNYLLANGVHPNKFETVSYGERQPISLGETSEDHAINRRVVIVPFKIQ